eukprot:7174613-Pyramimonas_sp.AAC.1
MELRRVSEEAAPWNGPRAVEKTAAPAVDLPGDPSALRPVQGWTGAIIKHSATESSWLCGSVPRWPRALGMP